MSESEHIAAASPSDTSTAIDEEDRLRPQFVERVLDAVEAGDDETARELVEQVFANVIVHFREHVGTDDPGESADQPIALVARR